MRVKPDFNRGGFSRLLGWTVMVAVCCFLLWIVSGMAANAEDPKAAARAIGQAGTAAAGAIAKSAGSTATVPGYAGTDVPERNLTASGMEDAARLRLADPDDPGGNAGRAVIEGTLSRPDRPVAAGDPAVVRGKGIATAPQSPAHGTDGLASGGVTACGAGTGGCGGRRDLRLGALLRRRRLRDRRLRRQHRLRRGDLSAQHGAGARRRGVRPRGHALLQGQAPGLPHQVVRPRPTAARTPGCWSGSAIAVPKNRSWPRSATGATPTISASIAPNAPSSASASRRSRAWCVFGSKLGRILQEQGRSQLGVGWGDCRGLTVAEIEGIDFANLDLSEFTEDLMDGSSDPSVSLPDAGDTGDAMRTRIRDFYTRGQ